MTEKPFENLLGDGGFSTIDNFSFFNSKQEQDNFIRVVKAFTNPTRLKILYLLNNPKTWTNLMFNLKLNPHSLQNHLHKLLKTGLVQKSVPCGYQTSESGRKILTILDNFRQTHPSYFSQLKEVSIH